MKKILIAAYTCLLTSYGLGQEVSRADLLQSGACMQTASAAEKLTKARIEGSDIEAANRMLILIAPNLASSQRQEVMSSAYGFSYQRLSPTAMMAFVFMACHYKLDDDIKPLAAKVAENCQKRHSSFEPLTRCIENVLLGLPPT